MPYKSSACALLFVLPLAFAAAADEFVFNRFNGTTEWAINGSAGVLPNGMLSLAPSTINSQSHAFYSSPFQMRNLTDGSIFSFSATFAFVILPSKLINRGIWSLSQYRRLNTTAVGDGIAFVLAPDTSFSTAPIYDFGAFGLMDHNANGNSSNHLLFIELDTNYNEEFDDIDENHVGINVNSMNSSRSSPAGYYTDEPFSDLHPMRLSSGKEMQVWIDYDQRHMQLNVSLAPIPKPKPKHPLLTQNINLSQVFLDHMYVGFSSSCQDIHGYFILGCSFKVNAKAASLDYSKLPKVNATQLRFGQPVPPLPTKRFNGFIVMFSTLLGSAGTFVVLVSVILAVRRCCRYREIREDWELEFGPHRFSYKDLFHATDGFKEKRLLGAGGFGKVYKGVLLSSKMEVAVKVMSHDSSKV